MIIKKYNKTRMKSILFLALILSATCMYGEQFVDEESLGAAITFDYEVCDDESKFDIQSVAISPEEITKGKKVTVDVSGNAVVSLVLDRMVVTAAGIQVSKTDLGSKTLAPGEAYTFSAGATIPIITPKGTYDVYLKVYDTADNEVSCLVAHAIVP